MALAMIVAGAVFDFFDGMSARLLGVSSPIGKELDSLAEKNSKINVAYVLSHSDEEGYEKGFVGADIIRKYASSNQNTTVGIYATNTYP